MFGEFLMKTYDELNGKVGIAVVLLNCFYVLMFFRLPFCVFLLSNVVCQMLSCDFDMLY